MRDRSRGNPHSRKRLLPDNQADGQLTEGEQQDPAAGVDNAAQLPGVTAAALNPQTRTDVAGVDVNQAPAPNNTSPIHSPPPAPDQNVSTIAEMLDKALQKEFHEDSKKSASEAGKNFNDTVKHDEGELETVVRISKNRDRKPEKATETDGSADNQEQKTGSSKDDASADGGSSSSSSSSSNDVQDGQPQATEPQAAPAKAAELPSLDKDVDRIIDSRDNEFVLSAPKDGVAALTLDPLLIQDLTLLLASAAVMGMIFEGIKQPVINGYLVAGAIVGPGGFQLIKELVQVESLAQLGVQLLLFGLGRELSIQKLRSVWGVALLGGSLQILALMFMGGAVSAILRTSVHQGVFIGALLSMSSTTVVIKCLEVTKATNSAYGQITIGTLILQDCSVGLMFAMMPAFGHSTLPGGSSADANWAVLMLVFKVCFKLAIMVSVAMLAARLLLPWCLRLLLRHASRELVQLSLVGFCVSMAWVSGFLELSEELGAFVAGAMVATGERALFNMGFIILPSANSSPSGTPRSGCGLHPALTPLTHTAEGRTLAGTVGASIESIENVLTALFVASIGLIMSPMFLWHHALILTCGTLVVMVVKSVVVGVVVNMFGINIRTSVAVGLSMAHIGEFSFVLLSMANQLKLLSPQLYSLLLGVTAMSLLTTPMVIMLTSRLLSQGVKDSSRSSKGWRHSNGSVGIQVAREASTDLARAMEGGVHMGLTGNVRHSRLSVAGEPAYDRPHDWSRK
eukprot:jgi/Chrzof1/1760/Cz10g20050.t1_KEA4[v5.2]